MSDDSPARACPSCGAPMRRLGGSTHPFWECSSCSHFDADPGGETF
ncbi:hypothetical protein QDR37_08750 [Amnibacterium sp. CER49]|nr:hypothetical protein [Amnibacterium sp. CER49]MDH2444031.1 hypothetical protein [Amnibacterium sp. CER49]